MPIECRRCCNSDLNPSIFIDAEGVCNICEIYKRKFSYYQIQKELETVKKLEGKRVLVGMSGGKDSTAVAVILKEMGLNPIGFTLDIGYYPPHVLERSAFYAAQLNIPHETIDIRPQITDINHRSYQLTADLYDDKIQADWKELYRFNRTKYSVKYNETFPYVRSCQLCRKTVIPAYVNLAHKVGVEYVILGVNEWCGLAGNIISGIRKLWPDRSKPPVFIVHLPFLIRMKKYDTEKILKEMGWVQPEEGSFVETNGNSCLFAAACEAKAFAELGFHPDTTRLSREVTVGFLKKDEAKQALTNTKKYNKTVRQVLEEAEII